MPDFNQIVADLKAKAEECVAALDSPYKKKDGCDFGGLLETVDETIAQIETSNGSERVSRYEQVLNHFLREPGLPFDKIPLPNIAARIESYRDRLFIKPPAKKEWKGHMAEVHLVSLGNETKEVTLLRVEKQFDFIGHPYLLSSDYYIADSGTRTDPLGDYNCFSLAFHTKDIPLNNGCMNRSSLKPYCGHDIRFWPNSNVETGAGIFAFATPIYPRSFDKACHDPADHVLKDGYRFVDIFEEEIKPGDRLIYLMPATKSLLKEIANNPNSRSPDPELTLGKWWNKMHIPQFPEMGIQHSAIVINVTENDIIVLEKIDHETAVISSAFDNDIQFGDIFAVIRKDGEEAMSSPKLNGGKCRSPDETEKAANEGNKWAAWFQEQLRMAKIREKNCAKNPKCPDF
jgi:hypothetical protein